MDPRVKEEGLSEADLLEQAMMQNRVIALHERARRLQVKLEEEAETLKDKGDQKARMEQVSSILKQLRNDEVAYPQEMLLSQISYLYNMTSGADQIIGEDAIQRFKELQVELERLEEQEKKNPANRN